MSETPITPEAAHEDTSAYLNSAKEFLESGTYEQAVLMLKAALILEPDNTEILFTLASAYYDLERYEDAHPLLQRARHVDPDNLDTIIGLGNVLVNRNKYGEALDLLEPLFLRNRDQALLLFYNLFLSVNRQLFVRLFEASGKSEGENREAAKP
jgi:tetratricopeptide (TPR) repeat protein